MDDHFNLKNEFNFDDYLEVPAQGRAGGIVLMWLTNMVNVTLKRKDDQELHAMIQVFPHYFSWCFSVIYTSTNSYKRITLWNNLEDINSSFTGPWLIAGDFNEILGQQDKWGGGGGRKINSRRSSKFWNYLNNCNLIDLEFKRCKYTWSNHRCGRKDLILERLDCAFANNDWLVKYPNAQVTHLPKTHSDHNPLLILLFKPNSGNLSKPFRLEKFWLEHPNFRNLVERCWINKDLISAISLFRNEAHIWSRETFGNIFKKKRTSLARL
ncbi:hypothetical protein R3W88_029488 [Solanum pinnatisectum]|uniref:Endonuclease/exonuclease/phosphatase domain-containing protein n=1 Tax=Solanum pinnatisectum TaxID=50273 RepID=A0AAV9K5I4_9SOLN|nr:hypothetical protein R3W88_029488 [Solanum pinnatisectum]